MSRWKQLFGGASEIEDSPTPARRTGDTAFEVFLVDNGLTAIYNETRSARGKEQRHIRDCCKKLLGEAKPERPICLLGGHAVYCSPSNPWIYHRGIVITTAAMLVPCSADAYQGQEGQVPTPVTAPLNKQACIEVCVVVAQSNLQPQQRASVCMQHGAAVQLDLLLIQAVICRYWSL